MYDAKQGRPLPAQDTEAAKAAWIRKMKQCLVTQQTRYPLMCEEDVVKFAFQGMLGVGHLIRCEADAVRFLQAEMAGLQPDSAEPLTESISPEWLRLNLRPAKALGLTEAEIARSLCLSAQRKLLPFTRQDVYRFCISLDGSPGMSKAAEKLPDESWLPSHSPRYREAYHPAYRVLHKDFCPVLAVKQRPLVIETERLVITEFTPDMARAVHENSLDEDNRKFVPDEVFETVEDAAETIAFLASRYGGTEGPLAYPVLVKNSGENIGYVQLVPLEDGRWEIGYHITKKATGRGYATESVRAFLPVITGTVGAREVLGICLSENAASKRVLLRCGFTPVFEGVGDYQGRQRSIFRAIWRKP